MFTIELIERKLGDIDLRVIPLENLTGEDLDYLNGLSGDMVEEIYLGPGSPNKMRKSDALITDSTTQRVLVVKRCVLLWTILQSNLKRARHLDQLCSWLNETPHTQKGELWLREREVFEVEEREGPQCLFGESLEEAMKEAPRGGSFITTDHNPDHYGNDISDEDLQALFDQNCLDLSRDEDIIELTTQAVVLSEDEEIEKVLEEFFSPMLDEQPIVWLTEEV